MNVSEKHLVFHAVLNNNNNIDNNNKIAKHTRPTCSSLRGYCVMVLHGQNPRIEKKKKKSKFYQRISLS